MASQEQIAQYEHQWEEAVDKAFSVVNADGWEKEKSKEHGLEIFLRMDKSSSFAQVKSIVTINKPIDKVVEQLKTTKVVDHNTPKHEREGDLERRIISTVGDEKDAGGFFYVVVASPSVIVSPREFLCFQKLVHRDNKVALVRTSIENDDIHKVGKGYVRGKMAFQAFIAEPEGDNTKLTFVVQADPCGSVPAMVYNSAATGQGYTVLSIKKAVENS